jgi:hypothetical protein
MWANDVMHRIDSTCIGLGRVRDVKAEVRGGNVVLLPPMLVNITDVFVNDTPVKYLMRDDGVEIDLEYLEAIDAELASQSYKVMWAQSAQFDATIDPDNNDDLGTADGLIDGFLVYTNNYFATFINSAIVPFQDFISANTIRPVATFDFTEATLLESNVVLRGYVSTAKPKSIDSVLDINDTYAQLLASGLRSYAEQDMDPASSTAQICKKEFETLLNRYRIDKQRANGESKTKYFNSTPSRGRNW